MTSTKEMIEDLKKLRKEKGLSYQNIADLTAANGQPVSLSTVKRMFAEDPGGYDFRYDTTILPVRRAIMGDEEPPHPAIEIQEDEDMTAAIEAVVRAYEARIGDLWKTIDNLKRDKLVLGIVILIMFAFILYLFADGLHGNWGIFRYPVE